MSSCRCRGAASRWPVSWWPLLLLGGLLSVGVMLKAGGALPSPLPAARALVASSATAAATVPAGVEEMLKEENMSRALAATVALGCASNKLIYNRVGKAGSSTMIALLRKLAGRNHFHPNVDSHAYPNATGDCGKSAYRGMSKLMGWSETCQIGASATKKSVYIHHVGFLDYELLEQQESEKKQESMGKRCRPMFINIVRDPISMFISDYYYQMAPSRGARDPINKQRYEARIDINECVAVTIGKQSPRSDVDPKLYEGCLANPFEVARFYKVFCGYHEECLSGDDASYRRAYRNVLESYVMVGITEKMTETIQLLERLLPSFYRDASAVFKTMVDQRVTLTKGAFYTTPNFETMKFLAYELREDYAFYQWLVLRFKQQLAVIKDLKPYKCQA